MTIKCNYPVFHCFRFYFDHDDFYVVSLKEKFSFCPRIAFQVMFSVLLGLLTFC